MAKPGPKPARTHRPRRGGKAVGSLILERVVPGVGRIKKASRIPTRLPEKEQQKRFEQLHRMIDSLIAMPRLDVLRRFKANKSQTPLQLYDAWINDRLGDLPEDVQAESFKKAFTKYIEIRDTGSDLKSRTVKDYKEKVNHFLKVVGAGVVIAGLPDALVTYRQHCKRAKTHRRFQYTRNVVAGFLRHEFGSQHDLYKRFKAVDTIKYTVPRKSRNPQEFYALKRIADNLAPSQQLNLWAMSLHGLMPDEWFPNEKGAVKWKVKQELYEGMIVSYVHIKGTKTDYRDRYTPIMWPLEYPKTTDNNFFGKCLKKATKKGELTGGRRFKPYDCRRSYKILLSHSGIPVNRIDAYMGHSPDATESKKYGSLPDLMPYLEEDRQQMLAYIKTHLKKHHRTIGVDSRPAWMLRARTQKITDVPLPPSAADFF